MSITLIWMWRTYVFLYFIFKYTLFNPWSGTRMGEFFYHFREINTSLFTPYTQKIFSAKEVFSHFKVKWMIEENINPCIIFYLNLMYPSLLLNLSVMSWTLTLRLYPLYWRYQARLVQHIKGLFRVHLVENVHNILFLK